jgi:hypothetical protein
MRKLSRLLLNPGPRLPQLFSGDGNDPDALAQVGCPKVGSGKHAPRRIKPEVGQVSKNSSESSRSELWAVLHKDESRSNFAHDASHFCPQSASLTV